MPCYDSRSGDCSDYIERMDRATKAACEMAKALTQKQIDSLSAATRGWITEHEKMDRERLAREAEAYKRSAERQKAIAKLSPSDRRALGLETK